MKKQAINLVPIHDRIVFKANQLVDQSHHRDGTYTGTVLSVELMQDGRLKIHTPTGDLISSVEQEWEIAPADSFLQGDEVNLESFARPTQARVGRFTASID